MTIAFHCRICDRSLADEDNFCRHCGWRSAELDISSIPSTLLVASKGTPSEVIRFGKSGPASLSVKLHVECDGDWVSFAKERLLKEAQIEFQAYQQAGSVTLYFNPAQFLSRHPNVRKLPFYLHVTSNDGQPELGDPHPRPWKAEQWQSQALPINVTLMETARLVVVQDALIFSKTGDKRQITVRNEGEETLRFASLAIPDGFEVYRNGSDRLDPTQAGKVEIEKGKFETWSVRAVFKDRLLAATLVLDAGDVGREEIKLLPDLRRRQSFGDLPQDVVCVDFGTSKTAIACWDVFEEQMFIPKLEQDQKVDQAHMPSCILFRRVGIGEQVYVGLEAERTSSQMPPGSAFTFLRSMKTALARQEPYRMYEGKAQDPTQVELRDPLLVVSQFLQKARARLNNQLPRLEAGQSRLSIFSLPVLDLGDDKEDSTSNGGNTSRYALQEGRTLQAARMAGFNGKIEMLLEPQCAALYILHNRKAWGVDFQVGNLFCVYDFGAGTLDITFAEFQLTDDKPHIEVKANIGVFGDEFGNSIAIGGDLIDLIVANHLITKYKIPVANPEYDENERIAGADTVGIVDTPWDVFLPLVRQAKERLNSTGVESVTVSLGTNKYDLYMAEFESLIAPLIDQSAAAMLQKMGEPTLGGQSLDPPKYIFLVGGSSLMPIVHQRLQEHFIQSLVVLPPSPEDAILAVSQGGALSYFIRIANNLGYEVGMRRIEEQEPSLHLFSSNALLPARCVRPRMVTEMAGIWEVVFYHTDAWHSLGTVEIPEAEDEADKLQMIVEISSERQVTVTQRLSGRSGRPSQQIVGSL